MSFFAKNLEAGNLLETFFVSSVSSLLIIRAVLNITSYPQLSGGDYHIAHMLWGGILMAIAIFISLIFLNKEAKFTSSVIGGIGFGAFIDEIGKFITSDNNYFFRPAIALIYVVFIILFLFIRLVKRNFKVTSKDYAINALEVIKEVILFDLDTFERRKALSYLHKSDKTNPAVVALVKMLHNVKGMAVQKSSLSKIKDYATFTYISLVKKPWFNKSLIIFFVVFATYRFFRSVILLDNIEEFHQLGQIVSSIASGLFVFYGSYLIKKGKRLRAYESFKIAILISIFLTQFFLFFAEQLSALRAFVVSIIIYSSLVYLIEQERLVRKPLKRKTLS